jgi:hypothetical protein
MREQPVSRYSPLKSYFLLGKIYTRGQPAGNFIKDRGSSETIREAFILKDNLFKNWFIGFLEGKGLFLIKDGHFLEFKIVHSSVDAQILFFIKKNLGFGVVRKQDEKKNTHCFRVNDKSGLLKIILILNGNIFLESRQEEFKLWVAAYNQKYGTNISYSTLNNSALPNLSNTWLSGFTDAVGSFHCSDIDFSIDAKLVKLSYILSQKGNFEQMKFLAELLKGKTHYLENSGVYNTTVNKTKLSLVINYLNKYPLKTKKSIVFFNWKKIYLLVKSKKHFTEKELDLMKKYKQNLNRLAKII